MSRAEPVCIRQCVRCSRQTTDPQLHAPATLTHFPRSCTVLLAAAPAAAAACVSVAALACRCVMGQQARRFDAVKAQVLSNLAEMLVRQLEEKWVAALQVRHAWGLVGGGRL